MQNLKHHHYLKTYNFYLYINLIDLFDFDFSDFTLEGYDPHPHIKGAVAV